LDRPLNLSVMMRALTTDPYCEKCCWSLSSVAEYGRFPTYNFAPMLPS
jgi:hypothetical protein